MNDRNLTDDELVRAVDNDPAATPREKTLAERLYALLDSPSAPARIQYGKVRWSTHDPGS